MRQIEKLQTCDGTFPAFIKETGEPAPSIFPTLFCSNLLASMKSSKANALAAKSSDLVLRSKSIDGTWNYLVSSSLAQMPDKKYPDDLDDTSEAISLLQKTGGKDLEGAVSQFASVLKKQDVSFGGPFNTWIVDDKQNTHWQDIDPVVNAHILECAGLFGVKLPNVKTYLENCIIHDNYSSKYYDSRINVLWNILQAIDISRLEESRLSVLELCKSELSLHSNDPLSAAMLLFCMIEVKANNDLIEDAHYQLMALEPFWPTTQSLYIEKIGDGKIFHAGSPSITLAVVAHALEAYEEYEKSFKQERAEICQNICTDPSDSCVSSATELILRSKLIRSDASKNEVATAIEELCSKPKIKSLIELPIKADNVLEDRAGLGGEKLTKYVALGMAGWAAWTYIDDLRDNDTCSRVIQVKNSEEANCPLCRLDQEFGGVTGKKEPSRKVVMSSILLSIFYSILGEVCPKRENYDCMLEIIGKMEQANMDEAFRPPNPKDPDDPIEPMAWKSMGAAIPLLAYMMDLGAPKAQLETLKEYFYNLILARQISDDACDWQEDMLTGKSTLITDRLEKYLKNGPEFGDLNEIFEKMASNLAAQEIKKYAEASLNHTKALTCFTSVEFLEKMPLFYLDMAESMLYKDKLKKIFNGVFWSKNRISR